MQKIRLIICLTAAATLTGCFSNDSSPNSPANKTLSGLALDGYLENAKVCLDLNNNAECDSNEPFAMTNAKGEFSLEASEDQIATSNLLVIATDDTKDSDINGTVLKGFTLTAPAGSTIVSPFSTLVLNEQLNNGASIDNALNTVKENLGLAALDLDTDYVAEKANNTDLDSVHDYAQALTVIIAATLEEADRLPDSTNFNTFQKLNGSIQSIANWSKTFDVSVTLSLARDATIPPVIKDDLAVFIAKQPLALTKTNLSEIGKDGYILLIEPYSSNTLNISAIPLDIDVKLASGELKWTKKDEEYPWMSELEIATEDDEQEEWLQEQEENPLGAESGDYYVNGNWVTNPYLNTPFTETASKNKVVRTQGDFLAMEILTVKKTYPNNFTVANLFSRILEANGEEPSNFFSGTKLSQSFSTNVNFYDISFTYTKDMLIHRTELTPSIPNSFNMESPENTKITVQQEWGANIDYTLNPDGTYGNDGSWKRGEILGLQAIILSHPDEDTMAIVMKNGSPIVAHYIPAGTASLEIGITNAQFEIIEEALADIIPVIK